MPNITVKHCTVLNQATLLPTENDGEPHDCLALTNQLCSLRTDLKDEPLQNPDLVLYVDGSASRDPDTGKNNTLCAENLSSHLTVKAAEPYALINVCKLSKGILSKGNYLRFWGCLETYLH